MKKVRQNDRLHAISFRVESGHPLLVIRRNIVVPVIRFEQRPTPAITPQGILSEAPLAVLDHDEPLLQIAGRMAYAPAGGLISSF